MRSKFEKTNMSKILKVIDPFFTMNTGDTFILSADGKSYVAEHNEEFLNVTDDADMSSTYTSKFTLSTKMAEQLVEDGYLDEVVENSKENRSFVNVFDEISNLIDKYEDEMNGLPETMKGQPECLKVEKTTVLTNILKVLYHLKSLRK